MAEHMTINSEVLSRRLLALDIDCDILKLTYSFDGSNVKVFDQGKLKSTWTVEQLIRREVYA